MNRLSLAELKAKANVVANVEAIKGGNLDNCHGATVSSPTSTHTVAGQTPQK